MDTNLLDIKFSRIGARLKVADRPSQRNRTAGVISLDVQTDSKGEFFQIASWPDAEAEISVLDVQPADRHLLLLVREGMDKSKFLCGHDERHWFVAAIPESAPVGTVRQAKEALKPAEVQTAQARQGLRGKARSRRKNAVYRRQGEWFFLAVADMVVDEKLVLRHEPLGSGQRREAALGRILLPHRRRGSSRLPPIPEWCHGSAVPEDHRQQSAGEGLGLAHYAAEPRRIRSRSHSPP